MLPEIRLTPHDDLAVDRSFRIDRAHGVQIRADLFIEPIHGFENLVEFAFGRRCDVDLRTRVVTTRAQQNECRDRKRSEGV
jgi:hypothetical protein